MDSKPSQSPLARWFAPETLGQSLGIGLVLTIASRLAGLWRGVLFARLMDRAELGVWAITNNTMQMLSVVLVLGIPAGLCRYAVRYERTGQLRPFLIRALGASFAFCGVTCLVGLYCCGALGHIIYEDAGQTSMTTLLCLGAFTLMALNLLQGVLQGLRVYRINAIMLVAQSLGFALLGGLLLLYWQATALAAAWAFLIVSTIVVVIPCWMLWKHLQSEPALHHEMPRDAMWRQLWIYSLGTWGASAVFSLWGWLDRFMLMHFDTLDSTACLEQLGTYHIVENVTTPLLALGAGWSTQVLAHAVHLWEAKRQEEGCRLVQFATKVTVIVMTCVAVTIVVFKRLLLAGVFGDTTMASGEILEFVLVTTCLLAAQCMVRCYVLCQERVWTASAVWVIALILSFLLNLLLVPVLHLKGAAMTAAVTTVASTWLLMLITQRAGLRLESSTWLITTLPLVLLLPPYAMLLGIALAAVVVARTDWLLTRLDKERLNEIFERALVRLIGRQGHAV
jgi:O-antigen/teichoic acid export membrane protein